MGERFFFVCILNNNSRRVPINIQCNRTTSNVHSDAGTDRDFVVTRAALDAALAPMKRRLRALVNDVLIDAKV